MRALIATLLIAFAAGLTGCASEEGTEEAPATEEAAPAEEGGEA